MPAEKPSRLSRFITLFGGVIMVLVLGLLFKLSDQEESQPYPTPAIVAKYKAGEIIDGTCAGFGPRCIDYKDLTHRQRVRCFTLRDETYDPFCARIRSPRGALLPFANDFALEGITDSRFQVHGRQCRDVRTSCYYVATVQGVQVHPCAVIHRMFERMIASLMPDTPPSPGFELPEYPGCSDHGATAHIDSTFLDPKVREGLQKAPPNW